ncbi:MAG: HEAT repeat domain-containing protein, partial [Terriglobales bacterium]
MSNANPYIQANSAAAILKLVPDGSDAVETLVTLFSDDNEQVRLVALRAVADAHSTCEKLVPALKKAWQDPGSEVRKQATECLAVNGYLGRITNDLIASVGAAIFESTAQADSSDLNHPSMPSDSFIKETMQHQFGENVRFYSARRLDQPQFLRKNILLEVGGNAFGMRGLGAEASGLYAFDGRRLMYLNGPEGKNHIGDILRSELVQLDQVDPVELARFFTGTLLGGYVSHHQSVVEPSAGFESQSVVTKPSVKTTESHDLILKFWTLC